jgi:hypothetical protein
MQRNRAIEIFLLALAVLPLALIAVTAARVWIFGAPKDIWYAPAWHLVFLQVAAIVSFSAHVLSNKRLAAGDPNHWLLQILVFQQASMFSYWIKHVWGAPSNLRP